MQVIYDRGDQPGFVSTFVLPNAFKMWKDNYDNRGIEKMISVATGYNQAMLDLEQANQEISALRNWQQNRVNYNATGATDEQKKRAANAGFWERGNLMALNRSFYNPGMWNADTSDDMINQRIAEIQSGVYNIPQGLSAQYKNNPYLLAAMKKATGR